MVTCCQPVLKASAAQPLLDQKTRRLEAGVAAAFESMIRRVRRGIDLKLLARAIERGHGDAYAYLDLQKRLMDVAFGIGVPVRENSLREAFGKVFEAGALGALKELNRVPIRKQRRATVGAQLAFDLRNPRAIEFLRQYTFALIRDLSEESREAIRDVLLRAFREGGHPVEQARLIRDIIGLTPRQTAAVTNYQRTLMGVGSELRPALDRSLRDRRFDRTVGRAIDEDGFLDADKIDDMADRYYDRTLKYRAETIARTETIRASNMGVHETWSQAGDQGLLDPKETRRMWIVSGDPATCDLCDGVMDLNPGGVGLNDSFETDKGPIDMPPLHPRCRCVIGLEFTA